MKSIDLKKEIFLYNANHLGDKQYWNRIVESFTSQEIIDTFIELLNNNDHFLEYDVYIFMQDMIQSIGKNEFTNILRSSSVVNVLEKLASDGSFIIRQQAAVTLSRINPLRSLSKLKEIFLERKEKDPLFVSILISEILRQSGGEEFEWVIRNLLDSKSYLTRWSLLSIGPYSGDPHWNLYDEAFQILSRDENIYVRKEALFRKKEMDLEKKFESLTNESEAEKERNELEKESPKIDFNFLCVLFLNKMHKNKHFEYAIEDIDSFLKEEFPIEREGEGDISK